MDGVEVRHPSHSSEDILRLGALVEHFSMVPSGGSDWHGAAEGPRTLGMICVPADWLGAPGRPPARSRGVAARRASYHRRQEWSCLVASRS